MSKPSDSPSGQPIGGQWAKQQKQGMANQDGAATGQSTHPQLSDEQQKKLEEEVARETESSEREVAGDGDPQKTR